MGQLTLYDWMQEGQSIHSVPPAFLAVLLIISIHEKPRRNQYATFKRLCQIHYAKSI